MSDPARAYTTHPPAGERRALAVEMDILQKYNALAAATRDYCQERGILSINLLSSPGSGKTELLARTIPRLQAHCPVAVIEGDQHTELDTLRIRAAGAPSVQINTGRACHLDAGRVQEALHLLLPAPGSVLFIENIGNLVCPTAFDLGESRRVVLLSVCEGDDKPLKYAEAFASADLLLITKTSLLPHVRFDTAACIAQARSVCRDVPVLLLDAISGEGMTPWLSWLLQQRAACMPALQPAAVTPLRGAQP